MVLLDPAGKLLDAVAYGNGAYASLSLDGPFDPPASLRCNAFQVRTWPRRPDVRHRFLAASPEPFERRSLPLASAQSRSGSARLSGGVGIARRGEQLQRRLHPPAPLRARALPLQGLDHMAIADPVVAQAVTAGGARRLAAWRWTDGDGEGCRYDGNPPATARRPRWRRTWPAQRRRGRW